MTWITSTDVLDCRFHLKQKPLGDWLEESGWCNLLTDVEIASAGKAESFLNASHITGTSYAHQVTAATLHILMTKAYEKHSIEKNTICDFKTSRKDKESQYPQFYFLSQILKLQLLVMPFIRSIRSGNFNLYKTTISLLMPCFLHLTILTMLVGCQFIYVICFKYKKPIQRFSVISMKVIL